jgi:hypothetical protein
MPVVNRRKSPGSYASICSRTWWYACSLLPSCRVRVARPGRKTPSKCLAEDGPHKSLSHNAREFHNGPRPNRACQRAGCNCDTSKLSRRAGSERGERVIHPRRVRILAFGLGSAGLPLKLTRRMPPQRSPPRPASQSLMCDPRALVHGVVDGHDDLHVWGARIVVLARHRGVELRLGGVYPVFFVAAGDGGKLAGGGERSWNGDGSVVGAGRS